MALLDTQPVPGAQLGPPVKLMFSGLGMDRKRESRKMTCTDLVVFFLVRGGKTGLLLDLNPGRKDRGGGENEKKKEFFCRRNPTSRRVRRTGRNIGEMGGRKR